ncbi:hypothetical protein FQA39_LY13009 [Lamprigera yunnana]|nr:hypothetical protein FQA39_LY13009 [Lamprigera yunnana]
MNTIKKDLTIPTPNRAQQKEDLAILKVRNLVISFGSGRKKVKHLALLVNQDQEKTTIGRAVMGIQPVSDGTVYFENKVAFGIAPNPYKLNLEIEHHLKMIKLNQNTTTLHIETQIQEFKRLFYKYVEGKYYDLKTKEVKDYTDGKDRVIPEGKNLKATKLGNSRKVLDLAFVKESVRDNLKRLLKVILIQQQLIKFLDGLSNLIDVNPELNIAIVKYQKRTHKLILKIKELENEIYLSLEMNELFSNLGEELEKVVQKHKELSVMRRKRIQKINERIARNEQRNNLETVKELNEVLKLMELPDMQTAISNSDRFANPTKKYHHELKKKMQMIFQDPASSLNDRMAVEGIIAEGLENFPELYKNAEAVENLYQMI